MMMNVEEDAHPRDEATHAAATSTRSMVMEYESMEYGSMDEMRMIIEVPDEHRTTSPISDQVSEDHDQTASACLHARYHTRKQASTKSKGQVGT